MDLSTILKILGGSVLTIGIIVFVSSKITSSQDTISDATQQVSSIADDVENSVYTTNDGKTIFGADVISIAKQLKDKEAGVIVDNGSGSAFCYGYPINVSDPDAHTGEYTDGCVDENNVLVSCSASGSTVISGKSYNCFDNDPKKNSIAAGMKKMEQKTSTEHYVNPSAKFSCTVIYSATTGAPIGICFEKQ